MLLPSGRVLIVGGGTQTGPERCADIAEFYDPASGAFAPTISLGCGSRATLLNNGKVLFTSGGGAQLFDPATETLRGIGGTGTPGGHATTLLSSGEVLTTGGSTLTSAPRSAVATTWIFDPLTERLSPGATMDQARLGHAAAVLPDGGVLVVGGNIFVSGGGRPAISSAELLVPASDYQHPAGLVAYWPGDGNADDDVGGNHGTLRGRALFAPGRVGQAFSFDGNSSYVSVLHNANIAFETHDFTVQLWVNFASLGGEQVVIEKWTQDGAFGWTLTKLSPGDERGGNAILFAANTATR